MPRGTQAAAPAAQDLGVPLVTLDAAVLLAFPAVAVRPDVFAPLR